MSNQKAPIYYTGIGSRETPTDILMEMADIAENLAKHGYILRSGGADGADSAFESGCDRVCGRKNIYIPWHGFNGRTNGVVPDLEASKPIVMRTHPAPHRLTKGAMKLHCRNPYQILGEGLAVPSAFVVAYTTNGELKGGTATALRLAMEYSIPVLNLGTPNHITVNQFLLNIGLHHIF